MGLLDNVPGPLRKALKVVSPITSLILDEETRDEAKETIDKGVGMAKQGAGVVADAIDDVTDKVIPNKRFMKEELEKLNNSGQRYEKSIKTIKSKAEDLHGLRLGPGRDIIKQVESYINTIANTPKTLTDAVGEYRLEYKNFDNTINEIKNSSDRRNENVVMGTALLAVSGPSSYAIGIGLAYWTNKKYRESAEEAIEARKQIEKHISDLSITKTRIVEHTILTSQHIEGTENILKALKGTAPKDYSEFTNDQKLEIGSLVNHITALSGLLNQRID